MYGVRLWAVKHSRGMERLYNSVNPTILVMLRGITKVFGKRLDTPITAMEAGLKGFLFDCQMCGDCALSKTGMSCPMNCPKQLRNGPCGGVRENGNCEVEPDMPCVWVQAWEGSQRMRADTSILKVQKPVDQSLRDTSAWLRVTAERAASQEEKS